MGEGALGGVSIEPLVVEGDMLGGGIFRILVLYPKK